MAKYYDAPDYEDADEVIEEPHLTVRDLIKYLSTLDQAAEVKFMDDDCNEVAFDIVDNITYVDYTKIPALNHKGDRRVVVIGG